MRFKANKIYSGEEVIVVIDETARLNRLFADAITAQILQNTYGLDKSSYNDIFNSISDKLYQIADEYDIVERIEESPIDDYYDAMTQYVQDNLEDFEYLIY